VSRPLRWAMVALVLVNLGFVYITEAARLLWLLPLAGLTVASPGLAPFARHLAYRAAWNLVVVGVFALLVHHFTSRGAAFLLEDGLLLAALCQVHLLNNAGGRQKPDLLFFNSFLIAVVTSFLSFGVAYPVVLALYAPVVVVALQLLALERAGVPPGAGLAGRAVRQGLVRGGVALAVTVGLFAVLPRDFSRQGLLGERWSLEPPGSMEVGFNPTIDLAREGRVASSDRVVMRVRLARGNPADVPAYWRGATLTHFDGRQWRTGGRHDPRSGERWRRRGARELARLGGRADAEVEVSLEERLATELFLPLRASRLRTRSLYALDAYPDFTVRAAIPGRIREYRVAIASRARPLGGAVGASRVDRRTGLTAGAGDLPPVARAIVDRLRAEVGPDAPQHRLVEAVRAHLFENFRYLPPGSSGGARTMAELFGSRRAGHCEVFATALALMLRHAGVPARVVTGYRSTEWDEGQTTLTVRALHAHAWVEALDPQARWYTVDATPAQPGDARASGAGWGQRLRRWFSGLWVKVVGFNDAARARAAAWLRALPRRVLAAMRARPATTTGAVAALVALLVAARRLRRRRRAAAAARSGRTLRRFGVVRRPHETPRALLARLELAPEQRAELEAATRAHEHARYG